MMRVGWGMDSDPHHPAQLTFEGDLQDLVRRSGPGPVAFDATRRASVKDVLESLGVPHTEVYVLSVDGRAVDFGHLLEPGQEVSVGPASPPVDVTAPTLLRPHVLPELRFAVDENVAKLAALLRTLGFDAAYDRRFGDGRIARLAAEEGRVVLSRDRALLKRGEIVWGRLVRAAQPLDQLLEVLDLFGVRRARRPSAAACAATWSSRPWTRGTSCTAWSPRPGSTTTRSGSVRPAAGFSGRARTMSTCAGF